MSDEENPDSVPWPPPLACDMDCDDGCSMTDVPVWMRPYCCRHVTAVVRRARDIVFKDVT